MQQPRLTRGAAKRAAFITGKLESIGELAKKIDETAITELVRRAAIPSQPDGYPTNTSLSEKSTGGHTTSSVEGAVLAKHPEWSTKRPQPRVDPVQRRANDIESKICDAEMNLRSVIESLAYVGQHLEEARKRPVSTPCAVCLVDPAVKAAYCQNCYDHWRDYGMPDRYAWQAHKQTTSPCPPPSQGRSARRGPWKVPTLPTSVISTGTRDNTLCDMVV